MEYKDRRSIYLQIADYMCENILKGTWRDNDRVPSIREMAVETEVNPNTVMRTYSHLQDKGIIQNQRGIGYFISDGAESLTQTMIRDEFIENELPSFFRRLGILGITMEELGVLYAEQSSEKGARE
ncbi:MAG: GntR family transcriptional regulator [Spirochaetales bacterium]|jgi:GntR family transcriptional regulator|nr:GntR family transcriptional regulator [Spirochaetales bacterium]